MMLLLINVNQILFCRFYSGNTLATPLGAVAAQGGTKGEFDSDMSFAGDVGSSFLRIPWMAF